MPVPTAGAENHGPSTGEIDGYYNAMGAYYGGDLLKINPYFYSYPVEVGIENEQGDTKVAAHHAISLKSTMVYLAETDSSTAMTPLQSAAGYNENSISTLGSAQTVVVPMKFMAVIEDSAVITRILAHLGLPTQAPPHHLQYAVRPAHPCTGTWSASRGNKIRSQANNSS